MLPAKGEPRRTTRRFPAPSPHPPPPPGPEGRPAPPALLWRLWVADGPEGRDGCEGRRRGGCGGAVSLATRHGGGRAAEPRVPGAARAARAAAPPRRAAAVPPARCGAPGEGLRGNEGSGAFIAALRRERGSVRTGGEGGPRGGRGEGQKNGRGGPAAAPASLRCRAAAAVPDPGAGSGARRAARGGGDAGRAGRGGCGGRVPDVGRRGARLRDGQTVPGRSVRGSGVSARLRLCQKAFRSLRALRADTARASEC